MPNANTITAAHINDLIARSTYSDAKLGEKTTVVCLKLPNGYEIVESSGCVDPANYDHAMGVQICKSRMVNRVWQLEGYRLQCELANPPVPSMPHLSIVDIAAACHEINRAYCRSLDDDSQPPWDQAPDWQQKSAINGVLFHLQNPNADASASHENWYKEKAADGWTFGLTKDPVAKTHPCCVPFTNLPRSQQAKDHIFRAVVHALMGKLSPVLRPERATTDGRPPAPGMENAGAPQPINPATGQHGAYYVLSDEERAKGFVRPVRRSYLHGKCGTVTRMSLDIAETYARDPKFYGSTFCCGCRTHLPVAEFTWDGTTEEVGS